MSGTSAVPGKIRPDGRREQPQRHLAHDGADQCRGGGPGGADAPAGPRGAVQAAKCQLRKGVHCQGVELLLLCGIHETAQTERTHVCPDLFDMFQALVPSPRTPASRHPAGNGVRTGQIEYCSSSLMTTEYWSPLGSAWPLVMAIVLRRIRLRHVQAAGDVLHRTSRLGDERAGDAGQVKQSHARAATGHAGDSHPG